MLQVSIITKVPSFMGNKLKCFSLIAKDVGLVPVLASDSVWGPGCYVNGNWAVLELALSMGWTPGRRGPDHRVLQK